MTIQSINGRLSDFIAGLGVLGLTLLTASTAHAQVVISEEGVTFPDNSVQTTATHTAYAIGDIGPGGGIVFYVTALGFHGLEAAPAEQDTTAQWCPTFTDIVGVENISSAETEDPNSGSRNTPLIAAECDAASAAGVAATYVWPNGQTDGFLPNKEELNLLYLKKDVVGGFATDYYWSSSERSGSFAWSQGFVNGFQPIDGKNATYRVRAVRAF